MKMPWRNLEGPAKLLAICGVVLLVSSGLCGLQWMIADTTYGGDYVGALIVLGVIELAAMAGSIIVGVAALIMWGSRAATNKSQPDGETPRGYDRTGDPESLLPREKDPPDDEKK